MQVFHFTYYLKQLIDPLILWAGVEEEAWAPTRISRAKEQ